MMTVGDFLTGDDKLADGHFYRHDMVYVDSDRVEHSGPDYKKVPEFMKSLVEFVNAKDDINDLIKAANIHFYIAFVHPYFDGNGRIARLVYLWFLIQKGYQSALFIPFSSQIEKSRKAYYDAYTTIEENKKYSGKIDVEVIKLWKFVLSFYGTAEFSTKQLEKDFGAAAYATIRGFVLKFQALGLLSCVKCGMRVKYKIVT